MSAPSIATVDDLMMRFCRELRRDATLVATTSPPPVAIELSDLSAGTPAEFRLDSAAVTMLLGGWSYPERHFTWNDGREAYMAIPVYRDRPTVLHFALIPFRPPGTNPQEVHILANGHKIAVWTVAEAGEYSMIVPSLQEGAAKNILTWHFPRAVSPAASGLNADPRLLAVALQSVRLHPL